MIIIISDCPMSGNKKRGQSCPQKKERKKERPKSPNKKKREGTMLLSFSTLVLHNSTMFFMIESFLLYHYHPLVFLLSFHILIALVHLLYGNPYSFTLISINGHLHSPLIRLVDVRLSSLFLSSPQPPFYSTYSAMSMAHAHVLHEN